MIEMREASGLESATWQDGWQRRLESWYGRYDVSAAWASKQVEQKLAFNLGASAASTSALTADGTVAGLLAVGIVKQGGQPMAMISDLWVAEPHRRRGYASAALRWALSWAQERGAASLWAITDPAEPAHAALFAGYTLRAQQMIKRLGSPGPPPDGLEGRPMTQDEFTSWRAAAEFDQLLPAGLSTADHTFLCLDAGGEMVATNWICHRRWPGVSWVYGVEVSEQHRGKGYGRAAMVIGEQATLDAGDTHLALNVFGHNTVAISLYDGMGYQAIEKARSIDL